MILKWIARLLLVGGLGLLGAASRFRDATPEPQALI